MALGAVCHSFQSNLSTTSHAIRWLQLPETQYKIVRALDPILDAMEEIALVSDAPPEFITLVEQGRTGVKWARDVLGIIYILTVVIPGLIFACKLLYDLVRGYSQKKEVVIHPFKKREELIYYEVAKHDAEKILCGAAIILKCLKGACALAATIMGPISEIKTHQRCMLAKHCCGLVGNFVEMGYHYTAYQREADEEFPPSEMFYHKKMLELSLGCVEKICQIVYDTAKLLENTPPPAFRIPLALIIVAIGLYKVWLKTA